MILPILLSSNKIIMSLNYRDHTLWLVYITIENLDLKTWYNQTWPDTLLLGFISIIYEWSKDKDNKNKDLKAKIYYFVLKTML